MSETEITGKFKKLRFIWIYLLGVILTPIGFAYTSYNIPNYLEPSKREILRYEHFEYFGDVPIYGKVIPLSLQEITTLYILPFSLLSLGIFCLIYGRIVNLMDYKANLSSDQNQDIDLTIMAGRRVVEHIAHINSSDLTIGTINSNFGSSSALVLHIGNEQKKAMFSSALPETLELALPVRTYIVKNMEYYSKGDPEVLLKMNELVKELSQTKSSQQ
jgi:hypothetical protein